MKVLCASFQNTMIFNADSKHVVCHTSMNYFSNMLCKDVYTTILCTFFTFLLVFGNMRAFFTFFVSFWQYERALAHN